MVAVASVSERMRREALEAASLVQGWIIVVIVGAVTRVRAFDDAHEAIDAFKAAAEDGPMEVRLHAPDGTRVALWTTMLALIVLALASVGCGPAFTAGPVEDVKIEGGTSDGGPGTDVGVEASAPDAGGDAGGQDAPAAADGGESPDAQDGAAVEAEAGPTCLSTLSGVGAGDFTIAFTLTTSETGSTYALLNQRTGCDDSSAWWNITIDYLGGITAMTDDGSSASVVQVEAGNSVNDGLPHRIAITRVGGSLAYYSDGKLNSAKVSDSYAFGSLPPLVVGADACGDLPLAGSGTIQDICITEP